MKFSVHGLYYTLEIYVNATSRRGTDPTSTGAFSIAILYLKSDCIGRTIFLLIDTVFRSPLRS